MQILFHLRSRSFTSLWKENAVSWTGIMYHDEGGIWGEWSYAHKDDLQALYPRDN